MNPSERAKCVATLRTLKLAKGGDVIQWADIDAAVDAAIEALTADPIEACVIAGIAALGQPATLEMQILHAEARCWRFHMWNSPSRAYCLSGAQVELEKLEAQRAADGGGVGV